MSQVVTNEGEALFAQKAQANEQLDIDTFIFAYVPGQDSQAPVDRSEGLPPTAQQVHTQTVQQVGRINNNTVVYSTVLNSLTGPFEFNWVGLYSSVNNTLVAISHVKSVNKTITQLGNAGNTLNRNFAIEYSGISDITGITVAPETWQLDFSARLAGMDALTQNLAMDMNGRDWFIGDGFKVEPTANDDEFRVIAGVGYVHGVRVELEQDYVFSVQSYPQNVYVDVWFEGDSSSTWKTSHKLIITHQSRANYTDEKGTNHYVFKLALINGGEGIVDIRSESELIKSLKEINKNLDSTIREPYVIYVSNKIDDKNLAVYPPIYDSLSSAMDSIVDNNKLKPYRVELLSGVHDAREILLKDYVDIVRSDKASSQVIIEHDFDKSESYKKRDIFKTCLKPYDQVDNFPIRCKLKGLYIRGVNLNYAIHGDFNENPELDIQAEDCIFFNGDSNSDAITADYGVGIGVYGRQKYQFDRCLFYGRYDPSEDNSANQQGAGWIVHNRASQSGSCAVFFNDCKSLKGWYGGRVVDYGSNNEDIISINGGLLLGEFAELLCFSVGNGITKPSITVTGNVPIKSIRTEQETASGSYACCFPVVISGFSRLYRASKLMNSGELVQFDAYQRSVTSAIASKRYKHRLGVVINNLADLGGRVAIQEAGVAAVLYDSNEVFYTNTEITNSKEVDGYISKAENGDGVIGTTVASSGFSETKTPGKVWVYLEYSGTKYSPEV